MHDVYGQAIPRYILANLHAQSWKVPLESYIHDPQS